LEAVPRCSGIFVYHSNKQCNMLIKYNHIFKTINPVKRCVPLNSMAALWLMCGKQIGTIHHTGSFLIIWQPRNRCMIVVVLVEIMLVVLLAQLAVVSVVLVVVFVAVVVAVVVVCCYCCCCCCCYCCCGCCHCCCCFEDTCLVFLMEMSVGKNYC